LDTLENICPYTEWKHITITGKYQGWEESESGDNPNFAIIKLDDDKDVYLAAGEDDAKKWFGTKKGVPVEATFAVTSFVWEGGEGKGCSMYETVTGGKILKSKK
jgi:hypothetical protein